MTSRFVSRALVVMVSAIALVLSLGFTTAQRAAAADPFVGYLMVHFTGESSSGEQIYLAHSTDGTHWSDLNGGNPVLISTVGTRGVRDPSIVRSPGGDKYWIIATDLRIASGTSWGDASGRGSTSLVVWESSNLVDWSEPRLLNVAGAVPGAGDAWAPEAIYNPATNDYIVYWATNAPLNGVTKHRIYYVRTTDFRSFTAPTLYIDRPGTTWAIDTQIIEVPSAIGGYRYYRATADGQITIEGSNSILGVWSRIGDLSQMGITNGAGDGNVVEGPMWMPVNGANQWVLWLDQFSSGRGYMPLRSSNLGTTQGFVAEPDYSLGSNVKRHGSILQLTSAEQARVVAKWGVGPANEKITNRNSGLVLDVYGASTLDGANVVQWGWNGGNHQRWQIQDVGGGYARIVNVNSGKCLDVYQGSQSDGASVVQWTCGPSSNQLWKVEDVGNAYVRVVSLQTGKCLDINAFSTAAGVRLQQWTCNGGLNQQWERTAG